ncbi:hypothetical protein SLEP1_g58894 [Rubroshorea leprosula]|uniref:Secreted protein n=1 Tax=Rubroshorea leprosula TaxID=152421 RepID=A0AAV5MRX8_9ROSI|nr:hypothetical protein SLEP1_g58894 [Rubroshorea leprosula]
MMIGAVQLGVLVACVVVLVPMAMAGWHLSRNKMLFLVNPGFWCRDDDRGNAIRGVGGVRRCFGAHGNGRMAFEQKQDALPREPRLLGSLGTRELGSS